MHKTLTTLALGAALLSANAHASDDPAARYTEEARKTAQEFMQKLGGVLKQQLQAGGPESAIGVCKEVAPALAAEYSTDGRVVKRVSLKPRNQQLGIPDAWEDQALHAFESRLAQGEPAAGLEIATTTEDADGRWFRYMKAIPTQKMCLQCHGQPEQISEGVQALLAMEYPDDKATGFSEGMLRGAVSIKRKLD